MNKRNIDEKLVLMAVTGECIDAQYAWKLKIKDRHSGLYFDDPTIAGQDWLTCLPLNCKIILS